MTDDITSDLFHCCALRAYVEVASETGQWPPDAEPDSEQVRRRAYDLYEQELRRKPPSPGRAEQGVPDLEPTRHEACRRGS